MIHEHIGYSDISQRCSEIGSHDAEETACNDRGGPDADMYPAFPVGKYRDGQGEDDARCVYAVRSGEKAHDVLLSEICQHQRGKTYDDHSYPYSLDALLLEDVLDEDRGGIDDTGISR